MIDTLVGLDPESFLATVYAAVGGAIVAGVGVGCVAVWFRSAVSGGEK